MDRYKGITIDSEGLPSHASVFESALTSSLQQFTQDGLTAVWLPIPIEKSNLISVAAQQGFAFHHSKPHQVVMTKWLAPGKSRIPDYGSTTLGAGGLVVNRKKEILVIRELHGVSPGFEQLPGGAVDHNEYVEEAAEREVFEETGVEAQFVSVLSFRHLQGFRFGCDDLYFICLMRLKEKDESKIVFRPQLIEVHSCRWVSFDEFFNLPWFARYIAIRDTLDRAITGLYAHERQDAKGDNAAQEKFQRDVETLSAREDVKQLHKGDPAMKLTRTSSDTSTTTGLVIFESRNIVNNKYSRVYAPALTPLDKSKS